MDRNKIWYCGTSIGLTSLSARRAWIEILLCRLFIPSQKVALRKESVDRNGRPIDVQLVK